MKLLISLTALVSVTLSFGQTNEAKLEAIFQASQTKGAFVLFDLNSEEQIVHNHSRATTRFLPASTFKIANSLIGLSTGAVANVEEILPYGGKPQFIKAWENDMNLRDAIVASNVPVYQELARRIGLDSMQSYVEKLEYGNAKTGTTVDRFWLEGPLTISPIEQTRFLARLAKGNLPLPADVQKSVREITKIEARNNWTLYGKTGWAKDIGWWVGWVEKEGQIFSFAINIEMQSIEDARKRIEIGKSCLQALRVID